MIDILTKVGQCCELYAWCTVPDSQTEQLVLSVPTNTAGYNSLNFLSFVSEIFQFFKICFILKCLKFSQFCFLKNFNFLNLFL